MYKDFDMLVDAAKHSTQKRTLAVAAAEDEPVIEAALEAKNAGLADPIFIGNADRIKAILASKTDHISSFDIVDAPEDTAAQRAVDLVKDGSANIILKGLLETRQFLGPIVKKENNLRASDTMSHLTAFNIANYPKLIMMTDGGMVMYPTLEEKRHIIENATRAMLAMGYKDPKHAVVCAIEKLNPKMHETVEAAELQKMNEEGLIQNCKVVGPISYDCALDKEIAKHKGFSCPYSGDFDCLIMPNMQSGNILGKCYTVSMKASMAGIIVGAKVPVVMTSRGSDANEKLYSIAMAALVAAGGLL